MQFAIYQNQAVLVLGIEDQEAFISFDNGSEEYVALEALDFIA